MHRRTWIATTVSIVMAGCSSKKPRAPSPRASRAKRPRGPKTMGNLLVDAYVDELKKGSPDKKIDAAKQLAAMGDSAKGALPALQSATKDPNAAVSTAAKQAIQAIKK